MKDRHDPAVGDSTFWHEFGHHVHQQKGVKTWDDYMGTAGNDWESFFEVKVEKLKTKLDRKYGGRVGKYDYEQGRGPNIKHYPTEYSWDNAHEWFAENYGLHRTGHDDLLSPEFLQFLIDENIF